MNSNEKILTGLFAILLLPFFVFLQAIIAFFVWNCSVRFTLHLPPLEFWQIFFLNWAIGIVGSHFKTSVSK